MPMALMSGWIAADALDKDGAVERGAATGEERVAAAVPAVVPSPAPAMTVVPRRSPLLVRLFTR
jgi:hypothetical protein